jgi:histidine triad (HIT) family protein
VSAPRVGEAPPRPCAFCEIVARSRPALVVFEDELCCAFLDHRPLFAGHVLLVPKRHVPALDQLGDELVSPLFSAARLLARAVEDALDAQGAFVAINDKVSQSVPHLHVHVVPRRKGDGLKGFFWPRHPYASAAEAETVQRKLYATIEKLRAR